MTLVEISRALATTVDALCFAPPVTHVYNPLIYARNAHEEYLERFGAAPKAAVLVGMNPGPFGMVQTGVPFGDVTMVREWMGIRAPVGRPPAEHPKRRVEGFACHRNEVSGQRLWGWARDRFGSAERFFGRFLVINYCPLAFLEESGRNFTPDKLPAAEREALFAVCDRALAQTIEVLTPRMAIGIGEFATKRLRAALPGKEVTIASVLHPSPASPAANRGWAEQMDARMKELGLL